MRLLYQNPAIRRNAERNHNGTSDASAAVLDARWTKVSPPRFCPTWLGDRDRAEIFKSLSRVLTDSEALDWMLSGVIDSRHSVGIDTFDYIAKNGTKEAKEMLPDYLDLFTGDEEVKTMEDARRWRRRRSEPENFSRLTTANKLGFSICRGWGRKPTLNFADDLRWPRSHGKISGTNKDESNDAPDGSARNVIAKIKTSDWTKPCKIVTSSLRAAPMTGRALHSTPL